MPEMGLEEENARSLLEATSRLETGGLSVSLARPTVDGPTEPVVFSLAMPDDPEVPIDEDGEGGHEDGPVEAGPDPTVASDGNGSGDAIVDAGGAGGRGGERGAKRLRTE